MTPVTATRAALVLATLAALVLARRRADHRPVAAFLVIVTVVSFLRAGLGAYVFGPARAEMRAAGLEPAMVPFTGGDRLAFYVEMAAFLAWPAGVAALTMAVYARRRPWIVGLIWAGLSAAMAYAYPLTRGDVLRRCYLGVQIAALLASAGAITMWAWKRERPTLPHAVVLCIVVVDFGTLIGPYLGNPFTNWDRAQALYLVLYTGIAIIQGGSLWRTSSASS
jgi:hypothetical protein